MKFAFATFIQARLGGTGALALGLGLALGMSGLTACSNDPADAPVLDQEFKLAYGKQAQLKDAALTLDFVSVDEDSRCPSGGECVWAGQARITLNAEELGAEPAALAFTLHGTETAVYREYTVQLLQLDPYPSVQHHPDNDEYRATLVVTRTAGAAAASR
ncbi:hypothetical protein E4T66_21110 [Sinimarinibacterium sp. CAU 1509]|uniref:hypothetical protein n=1 Tax=Sinimarinibacterium sp. CAU 1509 TaxID=2562283 RepID=UPI0010ACD023|nr:hypothetical protein [Sinimarinibacterium sp. CAU 1509]TJY55173.1 hypothetical protein E4T66_21110 [Sinimarinibacterium sp. CAU 1509]